MSELPVIAGMKWLRIAMPVPEDIAEIWAGTDELRRIEYEMKIQQAAIDALHQAVGVPMPVIGDDS